MSESIHVPPKLREILAHMANGLTNEQIALATGKSRQTIRTQATTLYEILRASNRAHAVAIGLRERVIE